MTTPANQKPILIVEADAPGINAARHYAPNYAIIPATEANLDTLAKRDVTIWFRPGDGGKRAAAALAARLAPLGGHVQVIDYHTYITTCEVEQLYEAFSTAHQIIMPTVAPKASKSPKNFPAIEISDGTTIPANVRDTLNQCGVTITRQGVAISNADNVARILENWRGFQNFIWFDEFYQRTLTTYGGTVHEWSDSDSVSLLIFLQREFCMRGASLESVRHAIIKLSHLNRRNAPRDWMDSLEWDGVPRLAEFLPTYAGSEDNEYTRAAGRNWWRSMVARIYSPGIKVDTMLILQGEQGVGKSTLFEIIGGEWYGVATADPDDPKAFGETIQGKLIMEMAELVNFTKADAEAVKRLLSTRVDRYRAAYAHTAADYPRQGVLVGTTNKTDFLQDETGARRFWPVECRATDLARLRQDRVQLFAEAVRDIKAWMESEGSGWLGHVDLMGWWIMPASTRLVQEAARQADEMEGEIQAWLGERPNGVTLSEIWTDCLSRGLKEFERNHQLRVAKALRSIGWSPGKPEWRNGRTVKAWYPIEAPF